MLRDEYLNNLAAVGGGAERKCKTLLFVMFRISNGAPSIFNVNP